MTPVSHPLTIRLETFASRRLWAPLDCCTVHPDTFAHLGTPLKLAVDVGGVRLALLALSDPATFTDQIEVPAWVALVGVPDFVYANVSALPTGAVDVEGCVEVEGPLHETNAVQPLLTLAREHIADAVLRQLRAGVRLGSGSVFAARISGQISVFRVHQLASPLACEDASWCQPISVSFRQVSEVPESLVVKTGEDAARRCVEVLRNEGLWSDEVASPSPAILQGSMRVMFNGTPASCLPVLLKLCREAGGAIHLPVLPLLWHLPAGESSCKTLSLLLTGFFRNMQVGSPGGPRVLVLWGLDGVAPPWVTKVAISRLASLRGSLLIGLCKSQACVPLVLKSLFDNSELPAALTHLGYGNRDSKVVGKVREIAPAVLGCQEALAQLTTVADYFRHTEMFHEMGITSPRLLLHGPSGTGKTHLITWLCSQLPVAVQTKWLHPGEVWSRYVGESEERLRAVFDAANDRAAGAVLFIEGLDQLAPSHKFEDEATAGYQDRVTAALLVCLDGIDTLARGPGLAVVATSCTRAEDLDSRITRPGRMNTWIPMAVLGAEDRLSQLQHFMAAHKEGTNVFAPTATQRFSLVALSDGMTPGSLKLAAARAWTDLPHERQVPDWSDVIRALTPKSFGTVSFASAAVVPSLPSARRPARFAMGEGISLPSSDEEGL